ncbi:hypothetical protein [Adhaeribacter aquaticus]|uniref:hypothetical protein n=1 Tax=Adhaeribacter aquaticus TaxID=299567 RepID=UPI00047A3500|nr:hypothetical protein [Adhaeribacter aquaticus]
MKAFQKFVQLSFILVVLMTMMGFRVSMEKCSRNKHTTIRLIRGAACCCKKTDKNHAPQKKSCGDMVCFTQSQTPYAQGQTKPTAQVDKIVSAKTSQILFEQVIRPELLDKTPHFNLPPPPSGRYLGILHQQFII